jgi:hypothetical protein
VAEIYEQGVSRPASVSGGGYSSGGAGTPDIDVNTAVVTPTDRVRWGPIIAGLFTALSTLALLSVLGVAVAGTAYDPGDRARTFGIGAGIWGAVSTLIAFAVGGWLAARSAAVRGHNNGLLNGAMVWAVAIPLMLYMIAGTAMRTVGTATQAATSAAQTGAQVAAQTATADDATQASARESAQDMGNQAKEAMSNVANQATAANTPENQERAADATARTAWGTLVSLLLALGAASLGGYLGARTGDDQRRHRTIAA